ncbi:hypothetical protein L4O89_005656, partial [Pseudomonas aeruginosa]
SRDGILTFRWVVAGLLTVRRKTAATFQGSVAVFREEYFLFISKNNFPLLSKNEKAQGKK